MKDMLTDSSEDNNEGNTSSEDEMESASEGHDAFSDDDVSSDLAEMSLGL